MSVNYLPGYSQLTEEEAKKLAEGMADPLSMIENVPEFCELLEKMLAEGYTNER